MMTHSVLLYLRCSIDTPGKIQVSLRVPNGYISYNIPILKVPAYTADKILNRGIDIGMSEGLSIGRTECGIDEQVL